MGLIFAIIIFFTSIIANASSTVLFNCKDRDNNEFNKVERVEARILEFGKIKIYHEVTQITWI